MAEPGLKDSGIVNLGALNRQQPGKGTFVINYVNAYQHAVRRYLEARGCVQRMVGLITKAAAMLEGERWKAETGIQSPAAMPILKSSADNRMDLGDLPSGFELVSALSEWREAWNALGKAWQALTPDNQVGLKEPKELY